MSKETKSPVATADPWETGELGRDLDHARLAPDDEGDKTIDAALNLQMISIRLEKSLIEDFKYIASRNKGIGYQTLMRQTLHRFATAELKKIANERISAERKQAEISAVTVRRTG